MYLKILIYIIHNKMEKIMTSEMNKNLTNLINDFKNTEGFTRKQLGIKYLKLCVKHEYIKGVSKNNFVDFINYNSILKNQEVATDITNRYLRFL